jgi:hypothetical protein
MKERIMSAAYAPRQTTRKPDVIDRLKALVRRLGEPHVVALTSVLGDTKYFRGRNYAEARAKFVACHALSLLTDSALTFSCWFGDGATLSVYPTNDANAEERRRCHKAIAEVRRNGLTGILHTTPEGDWLLAKGQTYPRAVADEYRLMSSYPDAAADFRSKGARREVIGA